MSFLRAPSTRFQPARSLVSAAVGIALGTAAGLSPALAQESTAGQEQAAQDATLPQVSVEAEDPAAYRVQESSLSKLAVPLLDTPQTITIIPQALIQARNATTLRDALRNTSGITFQAGEGGGGLPGDQNFSMRGFNSRSSLFADGIRDPGSYARDTFFIQQVEVAKGPAAVLAGRGATGGLVNQVTKTAHADATSDFDVSAGTDDYVRATMDLNQPFGESMAGRLNLMYDDGDVPGRDVVESSRWGVAPSFALGLGIRHQPHALVPAPRAGQRPGLRPAVEHARRQRHRARSRLQQFLWPEDYDYEDIDTDSLTGAPEHEFNDSVRVEARLRWLDTLRDSAITAPRPPNRQLQQRRQGNELLANQTNRASADLAWGSVGHTLVTGLEVSREDTDNRNQSQTANQPPILDVNHPDPSRAAARADAGERRQPGPERGARWIPLALYVFDNDRSSPTAGRSTAAYAGRTSTSTTSSLNLVTAELTSCRPLGRRVELAGRRRLQADGEHEHVCGVRYVLRAGVRRGATGVP